MLLGVLFLEPQDVQYRDTWIGPLHGCKLGASGFGFLTARTHDAAHTGDGSFAADAWQFFHYAKARSCAVSFGFLLQHDLRRTRVVGRNIIG
jgi:hypothetical protein